MCCGGSAKNIIKIAVIPLGYCRLQGLLKVSHVRSSVLIKIGLAFFTALQGQCVLWFRNNSSLIKNYRVVTSKGDCQKIWGHVNLSRCVKT
jgi:hypothetical protein